MTTPATEMGIEPLVERVARAMADDLSKRHYGIDRGPEDAWEAQTDYGRDEWRHAARAAIAAFEATRTPEAAQVEMPLVRQAQPFGCTAACLAMILGCSYSEAAAKLASDPTIFDTQGGGYHVMESQLVEHGFAVSRKWRVFQPGNQQRDPWPCAPFADLHWCEVIAGPRGGHAVLMLGDGTVLDPMSDEQKRLSDYAEVNFVAAVIPLSRAALAQVRHPSGERK
jgi:hypothetical protein